MNRVRLLVFFVAVVLASAAVTGAQTKAPKPEAKQADKKKEDCGCDAKTPPPGVLAVVNGEPITAKEIDDALAPQVRQMQGRITQARRQQIDLLVNARLVEAEARKRGLTPAKFINTVVLANVKQPTEAEARAIYEQNRGQIKGEFEQVKGELIVYIYDRWKADATQNYVASLRAAADIKILVEAVTPPEKEADRARVLATLNGKPITLGEVEDALRPLVFEAAEQTYDLRKEKLDARVADLLIAQEARRRNLEPQALIDAEIKPKVKPVTDEQAQLVYEQNRARMNGDFAQSRPTIMQYLQDAELVKAKAAYAETLKQGAKVEVYLKPPEPPVVAIATAGQPSKGSPAAPVTIVEFTDFECPACAHAQPIIDELVREYAGKVRLVVRDFPLDRHRHAIKAAEAAEAARAQGKYWEYVALLFQNQAALGVDNLKEYATRLGLDRQAFDAALDSGKHNEQVQADLEDGWRYGVNATPTVFVNGRRLRDTSREALKAAIDAALKK